MTVLRYKSKIKIVNSEDIVYDVYLYPENNNNIEIYEKYFNSYVKIKLKDFLKIKHNLNADYDWVFEQWLQNHPELII